MLIVDDLQEVGKVMRRYFQIQGFDVDCAGELEEAEALIGGNSYQIVITDLHLTPVRGSEGLEIVRMVRHQTPETKVILLTAYCTVAVEKEACESGLLFLLNKPVSLAALNQTVQECLGRQAWAH